MAFDLTRSDIQQSNKGIIPTTTQQAGQPTDIFSTINNALQTFDSILTKIQAIRANSQNLQQKSQQVLFNNQQPNITPQDQKKSEAEIMEIVIDYNKLYAFLDELIEKHIKEELKKKTLQELIDNYTSNKKIIQSLIINKIEGVKHDFIRFQTVKR